LINQEPKALTVSQLNDYLKDLLEADLLLQDVWIQGEITSLKYYQLGKQTYFNLSDGQAQVNCVLYDSFTRYLRFKPENGQAVIERGKMQFYRKKGTMILQVAYMMPQGDGLLSQNFAALKNKLQKEGLFCNLF